MANPTRNPNGGLPPQDRGEHDSPDSNPQVSFERGDVNIVQITGFGIGLLIATGEPACQKQIAVHKKPALGRPAPADATSLVAAVGAGTRLRE